MNYQNNSSLIKIIILLGIISSISIINNLYIDWLWFQSIELESVFTTTFTSKIGIHLITFVLAFLLFYINLMVCKKNLEVTANSHKTEDGRDIIFLNQEETNIWQELLQGKAAKWVFIVISVLAAMFISSVTNDKWILVQQFLNKVPFGISDPIFMKDISFYFFDLTFYQFIYSTFMFALVLLTITVGVIYLFNASTKYAVIAWKEIIFGNKHLSILLASLFALKAWGYYLSQFGILYSPTGIVYGATYTDIHANLLAIRVLLFIALVLATLIIVNIYTNKTKWVISGIATWIVISVVLGGIYPAALQNFVVQPNEFNREKEYIDYGIDFTRQAYSLSTVENENFNIDYNLTASDIENNRTTIDNIRLWDGEPLKSTYKSLQELRLYYVFNDIDIDRYTIDGKYRQVMLSARELDQSNLPEQAQTWLNQRLMYTHGYGVTMNPVNEVAEQSGFPNFFIKDIPPQFDTDLTIDRPEIYFGERTNEYVIVNTLQEEFDYPMGKQNVYTTYEGENGIKINSFLRRMALSWHLKDYNIMLSSDIVNESQVLKDRNIVTRVGKIAPYLRYDSDPYIVINNDGKLYWIIDAYTVSNKYPYSEPFDNARNNYIRNSVKVVVDAYTGEMSFYVSDPSDPLVQTYQNIFPELYKPFEDIPQGLMAHIRYPVDIFSVQADMYRTFHMTDTWVFYNKEDQWVIPNEIVQTQERKMQPYYTIMRLPGEEKEEYILMIPYTPNGRPNMIAWMCARMDGEHYGKMLVYNFPKQETVYGPTQIESRINQDTEISQQLALWDQRGSRIFRGNLLVIPIENSILYIEPLFLQAETSQMPELKRVFVAYGNTIVMEETLEKALLKVFGTPEAPLEISGDILDDMVTSPDSELSESILDLVAEARRHYDQANQALRDGNWNDYGLSLDRLNEVLRKLEETVAE